jgi:hypothetical protein
MRFELAPYHRNIADEELLADVRRVAAHLGKQSVTKKEFDEHSKYSASTLARRFGSWFNTLEKAGLEQTQGTIIALTARPKTFGITDVQLLEELRRVAQILGKKSVTREEFNQHGHCSVSAVIYHFGSWFNALDKTGLERTRTLSVTDEQYFEDIENVWIKLGRQPRYSEMRKPMSKYCAGAYEHRFGTWRKALARFVEFMNQEEDAPTCVDNNQIIGSDLERLNTEQEKEEIQSPQMTRYISMRTRFLVMRRDNFKCQMCGRSPATDTGIILHIDHNTPWSKGGSSKIDNLQTLCSVCNVGKSNL